MNELRLKKYPSSYYPTFNFLAFNHNKNYRDNVWKEPGPFPLLPQCLAPWRGCLPDFEVVLEMWQGTTKESKPGKMGQTWEL